MGNLFNNFKDKTKNFNGLSDEKKLNIIVLLVVWCLFFIGLLYLLNYPSGSGVELSPDLNKVKISQLDVKACTGTAEQPSCYSGDFPDPKLNWAVHSNISESPKYSIIIQIDDNSDFSSPEIDSGEITKNENIEDNNYEDNSYIVDGAGLEADKNYYWRIKIKNERGAWSEWAQEEEFFIISPFCD